MKASRALLTLILLIGACRAEPDVETSANESGARLDDIAVTPSVTTIEYAISFQFLPFESSATRGLIVELANLSTRERLSQRYMAWALGAGGWRTILEDEQSEEPTRAPWRIFPSDSLRLTVDADGDPDALIFSADGEDRVLELGDRLDSWEDRAGARHAIRQAAFLRHGARVSGMIIEDRVILPEPDRPARVGPFERAIVRSNDGAVLVLFNTREPDRLGDPYAWMYADGLTRRWTAVETRTLEAASSTRLRRNIPIRISFRIPEPEIHGELTAAEREFEQFPAEEGPQAYTGLYRVAGWIEFGGERRTVEGILERGEP
jgi:hypothetical protein